MGAIHRCRLCVQVQCLEHLVHLTGNGGEELSEAGLKVRDFLHLQLTNLSPELSQICLSCLGSLDFCIQFVDRSQRVESLLSREELHLDYIAAEISKFLPTGPAAEAALYQETRQSLQWLRTQPKDREQQQQQQRLTDRPVAADPGPPTTEDKVHVFKNNISVANVVVEVEPGDLMPRKAGNVSAAYPWRVGGANSSRVRPPRHSPHKQADQDSPHQRRKVRAICPKLQLVTTESPNVAKGSPGNKGGSQIIIPVALKTTCRLCKKDILASTVTDFQNHTCCTPTQQDKSDGFFTVNPVDRSVECRISDCGHKFFSKRALKYHQRTGHLSRRKEQALDFMSIATCDLVGGVEGQRFVMFDSNHMRPGLPADTVDTLQDQDQTTFTVIEGVMRKDSENMPTFSTCSSPAYQSQIIIKGESRELTLLPAVPSISAPGLTTSTLVLSMSPTATSTAAAVPSNSSQVEGGLMDGPPVMSIVAALSSEKWPGRRKVFVCPHEGCDKAYAVKNYLVEHERLHTGERPFTCGHCGRGFSRILDKKKHILLKVCH